MQLKVIKNALIEDESQQLAENLSLLLEKHKLNANQLAQQLGIPMMTVRRLMSGETGDPRISTLKIIADYFNVSIDFLIDENQKKTAASIKNNAKPSLVPLLDWETAGKITTIDDLKLSQWKTWQPVSLGNQTTLSNEAFALESRRSMYPRFPQGTVFIVEPEATPTDGDIVLVKIKKDQELTLRELRIDPPEWQLHPVMSGSIVLQYSKRQHELTGVVLLTIFYNRREKVNI